VPVFSAEPLVVSVEDREFLEGVAVSSSLSFRMVRQARGLLMAADGFSTRRIARELGAAESTVRFWRDSYLKDGVEWVKKIRSGRGRRVSIPQERIDQMIFDTQNLTPRDATHWSLRSMAKHSGLSVSTVRREWRARGLKPHLVKTFKVSNDPLFEEKLVDVVGLYMNPPENAIVFCFDEKSQIQALDRTQPSLPMIKGKAGTMTHDYKRHGTTTLFAALNTLTGELIGKCFPRHRNEEFLTFLKHINKNVPKDKEIHIVLDNYGTHKHQNIKNWLQKNPRFKFHFTPTSSSWLNMVERWFRNITDRTIRRGTFTSVHELIQAINNYIEHNNHNPQPFIWTKTAEEIIQKVERGRTKLKTLTPLATK
jgi:transposase